VELTEGSETSAYINQTPGNYPKGNLLYSGTRRKFKIKNCWNSWKQIMFAKFQASAII